VPFPRRAFNKIASLILLLLFLVPVSAIAQITEAVLRGTVTDTAGNVVVASPVVARSDDTGQIRTATTDDSGAFTLAGLPSGSYTIFVRVAGFKTFEQRALKLSVGQTTEIQIKLEVGEVQELVEISGGESRTLVSTEARLSDTFEQLAVTELYCLSQTASRQATTR